MLDRRTDMSHSIRLQARWVVPLDGHALSPGLIHCKAGRIVSVEEGTDRQAHQLGDVAVLPGLINAHTHLEFSDLDAPLEAGGTFANWIRRVVAHRRGRSLPVADVIRRGIEESRAEGTAVVGEIATDDVSAEVLHREQASGIVFREVLGLHEGAVAEGLATAHRFLESFPSSVDGDGALGPGLSPHAPYSVDPELFEGLISLAVEEQLPVAMHLAETREERQLLDEGRGPLVEMLSSLGLWRPERFISSGGIAERLRRLADAPRGLVIHGNYLRPAEFAFLAGQPKMSVVYCPRTHHHFGHVPHPWREMLEHGVRVVLGTDSRASNPDLSLFRELQWLHARHPDVPAERLLRMATHDAAIALGVDDSFGALQPGKRALLTVVQPSRGGDDFSLDDLLEPAARVVPLELADQP
jgi:cytosine/adenosine deaminase-related metal-dependent hydrolase